MRTCPQCERVMASETSTGAVVFICYCGFKVDGKPEDMRIAGDVLNSGETEEMYHRLIRNAPFDRVNQLVKKDCPLCGLDYMTQIRVGAREIVILACKCGYNATRAGGSKPAADH